MVRLVAMPSVMSTCVLMHSTHIDVGLGGMGREHMQHRTVGICFSGSGCGGAARPSVAGATSIFEMDLVSFVYPRAFYRLFRDNHHDARRSNGSLEAESKEAFWGAAAV